MRLFSEESWQEVAVTSLEQGEEKELLVSARTLPTLLEHVHWEAEAQWTKSWSKRIQPHSWAKRSQLEHWLLADGCLRHNCNVACVDYVPSTITRGNIKENTVHKQALGITDITSSFTSLWETHREKGLCGLPTMSSYFQLIEELALCLSAHRKCSWFADMLRLRNPGLPSVHMVRRTLP